MTYLVVQTRQFHRSVGVALKVVVSKSHTYFNQSKSTLNRTKVLVEGKDGNMIIYLPKNMC
jgi:hypothetical protein